MQLPSTFIKPIPDDLDAMLDEVIPGFRDPEKRVRQNEAEEPFEESSNSNDHDIEGAIPNINNLNLADGSDHNSGAAKASAAHIGPYIPINRPFLEKIRACQQALSELRAETQMQRAEIIALRKENERLRSELAQEKWRNEISRQFEAK